MAPIRHVFSLGTHCYTRWRLEQSNINVTSGPFDWLFGDLHIVTHCIEDGFKKFLDRSRYIPLEGNGKQFGHSFYKFMSNTQTLFNHHDMTTDANCGHFERASARFMSAIQSNETTLFAMFGPPRKIDPWIFEHVVKTIAKRRDNFKVLAALIHSPLPDSDEDGEVERPAIIRSIGASELYEMSTSSTHVNGLAFANQSDDDMVASIYAGLEFERRSRANLDGA